MVGALGLAACSTITAHKGESGTPDHFMYSLLALIEPSHQSLESCQLWVADLVFSEARFHGPRALTMMT